MKINITTPKGYTYIKLISKTKTYMKGEYNKNKALHIFEGKDKRFYTFIQNGAIQIELIDCEQETLDEIQKYLEYLFRFQYIGITLDGTDDLKLKLDNVECFYM